MNFEFQTLEKNTKSVSKEIAIIGMAGRFPEATNLEELYHNLKSGRDSVRVIDLERIRTTAISAGARYKHIAYLNNIDKFDHQFFGILKSEAVNMAPQQRIMLEIAYEAIENAGYAADVLRGTATSVYIASNPLDYYRHAAEFDPTLLTGNLLSCIPGRISRFFNFTGSAIHIDTACSSSLVALHLACEDILAGNVQLALCGGIKLILFPSADGADEKTGITSAHARCKTFSDEAEGAGMGEGAAIVLLKPLQKALEDNDNILGVIRGTAVNQDAARSSTLTAPSSIAQAEVVRKAIVKSGIHPTDISYIEAHGTGTYQGDPIEIEGLRLAFESYTNKKQFCAISSLKSNIGHTDTAAGIAGVIKMLLSFQHKELFPSIHVNRTNPHINFIESPLYVNIHTKPWAFAGKRIAGVSAFGISGTNCHAILEEWNTREDNSNIPGPYLFCFSAKSSEALERYCRVFRQYIDKERSISLARVSFTLNTGRNHYAYRKTIVAETHEELIRKLDSIVFSSDIIERQASKIWFLFSPSDIAKKYFIESLANMFPAYRDAFDRCNKTKTSITEEERMSYTFAYSFCAFLKDLGLDVDRVAGMGIGKEVAKTITGNLSPEEVLATLKTEDVKLNAPKWGEFVKTKLSDGKSIVCEIGAGSSYYAQILEHRSDEATFEAINPTEHASSRALLLFIGKLMEQGYTLNLQALYLSKPVKVVLPSYQFEKTACWLSSDGHDLVQSWIYQLEWAQLPPVVAPAINVAGEVETFVLYGQTASALEKFASEIQRHHHHVIKVVNGVNKLDQESNDLSFEWIDPTAYDQFAHALSDRKIKNLRHIFLTDRSTGEVSSDEALQRNLYCVMLLVQALVKNNVSGTLCIVTANAVMIDENDHCVNPFETSLHGFAAGINAEHPDMKVRCIDADVTEVFSYENLYREIQELNRHLIVALRNGKRYGRRAGKAEKRKNFELHGSAVYILAGGSNGIGLQILSYLSLTKAKIVVIGRRKLPHKIFWKSVTAYSHPEHFQTVQAFLQAERNGAAVDYFAADISDERRVEEIFQKIKQKHGAVRGIINAAGVGGQSRIQRHSIESFRETLLPKIHGTQNLYKYCDNKNIEFFIVFSSLNAIRGAERESNYSAANAFLDGFAAKLNREGIPSASIRWPYWSETGMGARMNLQQQLGIAPDLSITNQEGIDIFNFILQRGFSDVVAIKKDINGLWIDSIDDYPFDENPHYKTKRENYLSEVIGEDEYLDELLQIWCKVLSREHIGLHDNFFQMGGHSLLALQVRNQVEKRMNIKLEYKDIVECSTISALLNRLKQIKSSHKRNDVDHIPQAPPQTRYPLSEAQKGLWFATQSELNKSVYNVCLAYQMSFEVEEHVLKSAIDFVLLRHEILRTAFSIDEEVLYQTVLPPDEVNTPLEIDFISSDEQRSSLLQHVADFHFELHEAPLFKIWLVKSKSEGDILLVSIHHIIVDGWSAHILMNELLQAYLSFAKGTVPELPSISIQYKDYAAWENERLVGHEKRYREFWSQYLKDLPPALSMPLDFERKPVRSGKGKCFQFQLSPYHVEGFDTISHRHNVSKFLITFSMLQLLLYRYTAQNDFFVGIPTTLRNRSDLENQIGYYVNILPFRCKVSGSDTFSTLLHRASDQMKVLNDFQLYPFSRIVKDAGVTRERGRHYLFDISFSYDHQPPLPILQSKITANGINFESVSSKYDIEFVLQESGNTLVGSITYDQDLFAEKTIQQFADHFRHLADIVTVNMSIDQFLLEENKSMQTAPDIDFNF